MSDFSALLIFSLSVVKQFQNDWHSLSSLLHNSVEETGKGVEGGCFTGAPARSVSPLDSYARCALIERPFSLMAPVEL